MENIKKEELEKLVGINKHFKDGGVFDKIYEKK